MSQIINVGNICWRCNGDGSVIITYGENERLEDPCTVCGGDGVVSLAHIVVDPGMDVLESMLSNIIAEQASQREDLTAALTQIWNKVKNL